MKITVPAYAKINLCLDVTSRRQDGYHNIESVMQSVSLHDTVSVSARPGSGVISLTCTDDDLPCDSRNLAYRAAAAYAAYVPDALDISIEIEKRIPVAAGLAGGSSDAAAVLRALNECCDRRLSYSELCRIGSSLGADVPFCIAGGTVSARGIGDILSPCTPLRDVHILICKPSESVSTARAYAEIDRLALPPHSTLVSMESALRAGALDRIADAAYNIFEAVMPPDSDVFVIKRTMKNAAFSLMSGSGPSVFGVYSDRQGTLDDLESLASLGFSAFVCEPAEEITA